MDATALPKGHIIGWAPPPKSTAESAAKPLSKSAKKNAKRREKKAEKKEVPVDWEEEAEEETPSAVHANGHAPKETVEANPTQDTPNSAIAPETDRNPAAVKSGGDTLATEIKKMVL